ncbi:conserved hypothetical protein [Aspergillus terreus NIH2624]|uniref:CorA-like transporter domain-containing protein n=1 Tax=Aspergillus terreus (strain NIH 2624 / FGSC A1156) TaxID=341663 RepID=Q0CMU5_ASPTN|nr:uncharacterized protein ATEG_04989 [Aspergillus terreus NIH2624]EAU34058.1 conserved hypothetical protein [Aspergillus terreus NIH2624]
MELELHELPSDGFPLSSSPTVNQSDMTPPRPDAYEAVRRHLRYPAFVSHPEKSDIYVFENTSQGHSSRVFANSELFESHLITTPKPAARVVSICSQTSVDPLKITAQAMQRLMSVYDIDASFLDLVVSFGDKPRASDAGHGGMNVKRRENGAYDMHYLFAYAEGNNKGESVSWTIRQVCVFHRHDPSGSGNLWILLHANHESRLQKHIQQILSTSPQDLLGKWSAMHLTVQSAYLGNWRWYIRSLSEKIETAINFTLALDLRKPGTKDSMEGLGPLMNQQYLRDKIVTLASQVGVALTTLQRLDKINTEFRARGFTSDLDHQTVGDSFTYQIMSLEGYLKSVGVLERRVRSISDMLPVALTLENQALALDSQRLTNEINNQMLELTSQSFDENITVRVVTLVTLIYLPASFVSTLLGMNLFDFDNSNHGFSISYQFWIFVVIAVPLTLLTLGTWYLLTKRRLEEMKKKKQEKGMV